MIESTKPATLRNHSSTGHPVFWVHKAGPLPPVAVQPGTSALAVVSEIEARARTFAETGEIASIDLHCLKAMPEERDILSRMLGEGEVSAVVNAAGRTEIRETAVPCVWWIHHRDYEGATVGESIEVTRVPDLIEGDRKAVLRGLELLNAVRSARA